MSESISTDDGDSRRVEYDDLLAFVPSTFDGESRSVTTIDFERLEIADDPHGYRGDTLLRPHEATVSRAVLVESYSPDERDGIAVFEGEVSIDGHLESYETADGVAYELYEEADEHIAIVDDVILVTASVETIETALETAEGDAEQFVEANPLFEEGLERLETADHRIVTKDDTLMDHLEFDDGDVRYTAYGITVDDPDTRTHTFGVEFADESLVTDETVERLEAELPLGLPDDDNRTDVDGTFVAVSSVEDLVARREAHEHDSPRGFSVGEIDLDAEYVEIEIGQGDPTPLEELTLEVGEDPYDEEIWARDHSEIAGGDTIYLDVDDVEPNLRLHIRHETDYGSSGSGTTILNRFQFEFDYDYDSEAITTTYGDEFPLDGDKLTLAVLDDTRHDPDAEPLVSTQPWEGTLEVGDDARLEEISPGSIVIVGWDGETLQDSIANYHVRPPGRAFFEYEYASESVTVELEFDDGDGDQPAANYELRIDDEPPSTQWVDEGSTVESGASLVVEDVEIGAQVSVVWGDNAVSVGQTVAQPVVDLEIDADATLTHVGGPSLPASELSVTAYTEDGHEELELTEQLEGAFSDGTSVSLEFDAAVSNVSLEYADEYHVGSATVGR